MSGKKGFFIFTGITESPGLRLRDLPLCEPSTATSTDNLVYQDRPIMGVLGLCNTTVTMALSGQPPNLHIMAGIIPLVI